MSFLILKYLFFRFKTFAKLDKKSDENLSDYYKVFIAMCKRQAGEKLLEEERGLDGIIDDIGEDHAKLILDRLELLSKLRETAKHSKLEERLKLCENNLDTPDWWESGKHDRELIRAVLKHGLYRSDQLILNDPDFPFMEAEKRYVKNLEVLKSFKFDNPAELFKLAMGEMPAPPKEKVKETPKKVEEEKIIEPKPVEESKPIEEEKMSEEILSETPKSPEKKVDEVIDDIQEKPIEEKEQLDTIETPKIDEITEDKIEEKMEVDQELIQTIEESKEKEPSDEKMETDEPKILETPEIETAEKEEISKIEEEKSEPLLEESKEEEILEKPKSPEGEIIEEKKEEPVEIKLEPIERPEGEPKIIDTVVIDDEDTLPGKAESSPKKTDIPTRFPDLEMFKPLMQLKQFDAMLKGDVKDNLKALSRVFDTSMIVKWFREFALEKRISHIIYCVEKGVWPVGKSYSAYSGCLGIDLDLPLYETVKRLNADKRSSSSTPDVITITTDHHQLSKSVLSSQLQAQMQSMTDKGKKGQKRHIAIDVETERAKLHALLNNTGQLSASAKGSWNEDEHELRRASGSSGSSLQPPPAHQHVSRASTNSQYNKPSVTIPGTSSTLTPIDLSSR